MNEFLLAARIGIFSKYILIELEVDLLECHLIFFDFVLPLFVVVRIFSRGPLLHDHVILHLLQNCSHAGQEEDSMLDIFVCDKDLSLAFGRHNSLEHLGLISVGPLTPENSQQ